VNANYRILKSPKLGLSYARRIIEACPDVAGTSFVMYEQNLGFAMLSDRSISEYKCKTDPGPFLAWGEKDCH
jgi:hypothetical protein